MKYWLTFRRDVPVSHGYMYLFILVKYLMHAVVEVTLWTVLRVQGCVRDVYTKNGNASV